MAVPTDPRFGEMLDTSPEERRRYFALLARKTPAERGAMMASSSAMVRTMALAGIRRDHPAASERELQARLVVRLYGPEAALRLFGYVPEGAR